MTRPAENQQTVEALAAIEDLHATIDTLHYYSDKKRHTDDAAVNCPACSVALQGHDALAIIKDKTT